MKITGSIRKRVATRLPGLVFLGFGVLIFAFPGFVSAQPPPIPQGTKCAECGMSVDRNSNFSNVVATTDNKTRFFCDIGDMLLHFKSDGGRVRTVYVRDYVTGQWMDGKKAFYVLSTKFKTPMSWGIAAFAEESAAKKWGTPVAYDSATSLLK
ncbi:MAG: nitrous oxide reductase accessory protein NosL [Nitrospirae bacterium]|nr:nitrous oxide reductase accessory protein NosL [Nitrospirota bacterium]